MVQAVGQIGIGLGGRLASPLVVDGQIGVELSLGG